MNERKFKHYTTCRMWLCILMILYGDTKCERALSLSVFPRVKCFKYLRCGLITVLYISKSNHKSISQIRVISQFYCCLITDKGAWQPRLDMFIWQNYLHCLCSHCFSIAIHYNSIIDINPDLVIGIINMFQNQKIKVTDQRVMQSIDMLTLFMCRYIEYMDTALGQIVITFILNVKKIYAPDINLTSKFYIIKLC